jgi:hypothetical protein
MNVIAQKIYNRILCNLYEMPCVRNPAEFHYQLSLDKHLNYLPVISTKDLTLVRTLRSEGVAITSLEELLLPSTQKMIDASNHLIPRIPPSISGNKHEYVVHATSEQMMEYPEIFLWGLQKRLLNIVENYLGLPVAYHGAYFRRDLANNVKEKSRLWHLDKEDRKVIKIIVYLHDVNHDGGPFEYIPRSLTPTITRSLRDKYSYVQDNIIQKVVPSSKWKSCTGPAGTVVVADTRNVFHRGKIPVIADRFTIFYDYTCRQPLHPFYCKSSLPQDILLSLTSTLSIEQRECVFWR